MKHQAQGTLALLLLGTSAHAFGQAGGYYRVAPVQLQIEGGAAVTTGTTSSFLNSGYTLGGGITLHPEPGPLALRATFDYTRLPATQQLINDAAAVNQANINGGHGEIYSLRANLVYEWPLVPYSPVRAYLTGGVGGAYENVVLTQTILAPGPVCNWWVCGTAVQAQQSVVARNDTTRFTWNAGVGVDVAQGPWQSWFVEVVFEKVATPQPTTFVPLRVGLRF
jgi:opacity protein-like surface antigen